VKVQKERISTVRWTVLRSSWRGDAVAGIIITLVNIIAALRSGCCRMDLSLSEALQKFTLLSIGDGLVSQIPALILSVGAGILVTRASENSNLGTQLAGQLFRYPRALKIAFRYDGLLRPDAGNADAAVLRSRRHCGVSRQNLEGAGNQDWPCARAEAFAATTNSSGASKGASKAGGSTAALPAGAAVERRKTYASLVEVDVFAIEIGYGLA